MKEHLDNLIRELVGSDPPRWAEAVDALAALDCPAALRDALSVLIARRARLADLWPHLDELTRPRVEPKTVESQGGAPIDWSRPPIGDDMINEFFFEVEGFLADIGPLLVDATIDDPGSLDEIHRGLHTIKGNSGMVGLTPLMRVVHVMEDLVKKVQTGDAVLDAAARGILLEGIGVATEVARLAREGSSAPVDWEGYRDRVVGHMNGEPPPKATPAAAAPAVEVPATPQCQSDKANSQPRMQPSDLWEGLSSPEIGPGKGLPQRHTTTARPRPKSADSTRTLRVDFARLDRLVNLVGEQVTTENRLGQVIQQFRTRLDELRPNGSVGDSGAEASPTLTLEDGSTWSLEDFYEALEQTAAELERTSGKLQSSVLGMRMVRIGRLFNRQKATVFQVSNALGKKARLAVEGGDAELDKRLVEQLEDPLLHLVRNAVSHGVDSPEARRQQGKPEEGTVTLRAYPEGNLMVIEVADDGVGIDHEVLRRKAVEKGFLRQEEAASMDKREAMELVFAPGFSTTTQVNDISGRGVGLDVVQERIARLGGAVTLDSRPGEGTTFRLTVPLTLALTRALLVEVHGEQVAVPVANVRQVHHLEEIAVIEVGGRSMASVGAETLPFIDLGPCLGLTREASPTRGSVILLRVVHGDRLALFLVQRVLTQQQVVVKDLGALLGHVSHCMGATINDDRCVLILDSASLIREWGHGSDWVMPSPSPAQSVEDVPAPLPATRAVSVAVLGDAGAVTGLEDSPLFEIHTLPADAAPGDAAAVILWDEDEDRLLARVGETRLSIGPRLPLVALLAGSDAPAAIRCFDAGADEGWGDALDAAERATRLDRLLALYRHMSPAGTA